jgi:hypothetical protein
LRSDGSAADGSGTDPFGPLAFQYWPDTVSDTKTVNWAAREIPGGSLPIYQWISSGERIVSFTATFTSDMDLASSNASADLGNRLKNVGQARRNVDIRSAIAWLRSFMHPTYGSPTEVGVPLAIAPQRIKLILPGSGIGVGGAAAVDLNDVDEILCVMTQCDVTYESSFPSGLPRVVTVGLAFAQIAQRADVGVVTFPDAANQTNHVLGNSFDADRSVPLGYKLSVET